MKRQTYTILSEMLFVALTEIQKTRLAYSCKIRHEMCDKNITILLKNGLLEKKEDRFHTTKKGLQFIKIYQELEDLLNTT